MAPNDKQTDGHLHYKIYDGVKNEIVSNQSSLDGEYKLNVLGRNKLPTLIFGIGSPPQNKLH